MSILNLNSCPLVIASKLKEIEQGSYLNLVHLTWTDPIVKILQYNGLSFSISQQLINLLTHSCLINKKNIEDCNFFYAYLCFFKNDMCLFNVFIQNIHFIWVCFVL